MKKSALFPLLLLVAALPMCSGGSGDAGVPLPTGASPVDVSGPGANPTPAPAAGLSTLRVNLTDKPAEEYQAVNVTITAVRVHQSSGAGELDGGWIELPVTAAMPVDLLTLRNGVLYALCQAQLPAGNYQQIRLELEPNSGAEPPFSQSVVTADGAIHALETPSGTIKINHGLPLTEGQPTELTLDFDASKSVKQQGNGTYFMTPVITAASSQKS